MAEAMELNDELQKQIERHRLSAPDGVLESSVTTDLVSYLSHGGEAPEVVTMLSENYSGYPHAIDSLGQWLSEHGMTEEEVSSVAEAQVSHLVSKHFAQSKVDDIFAKEVDPLWVNHMVAHPVWRNMLSGLAAASPGCFFLSYTNNIIRQKGYESEAANGDGQARDVAAFAGQVTQHITEILHSLADMSVYAEKVKQLADLVCSEQHFFVYAAVLLQAASKQRNGHKLRRILQDLLAEGLERNHNVLSLGLMLSSNPGHQQAVMSLHSMLSRQALNPSDITVLHRLYKSANPPPVELIRQPQFLELLITSLFKPGTNLNPDHLPKYSHLLVYAASVFETSSKGNLTVNTSELKDSQQALVIVRAICRRADSSLSDLLAELPVLFDHLRLSVISMVMMRWCAFTLSKESVFSVVTDTIALPFVILDEIATLHSGQHSAVFELYAQLTNNNYQTLDTLVQLELKKTLMDRFLHLISLGFVPPVLQFIFQCTMDESFDRSVLRHFVSELLDMVSPPFSSTFMEALLPIVQNSAVTSSLRTADGKDAVSKFIEHCQSEMA